MATPAKFRDALSGMAVVTRGIDSCLTIYSIEEWKKLTNWAELFFFTFCPRFPYIVPIWRTEFCLISRRGLRSGASGLPQVVRNEEIE